MKKIIYIFMICLVTSLTVTSCTKEEVKPSTGSNAGGTPIKE
jgi:hypothetical protein